MWITLACKRLTDLADIGKLTHYLAWQLLDKLIGMCGPFVGQKWRSVLPALCNRTEGLTWRSGRSGGAADRSV